MIKNYFTATYYISANNLMVVNKRVIENESNYKVIVLIIEYVTLTNGFD